MAADTGKHAPFMGSVTATTAPQSLRTMLQTLFTQIPDHACYIAIQLDTLAGGTMLYVGNSTVSATNCGVNLSANQAQFIYAFDSNLITISDIYLLCSTGTVQVNCTVMVR